MKRASCLPTARFRGGNGSLKLISVEENDVKKDGTLVYLTFKVRDGASGDCEIKLINDENSVCNYNEESIAINAVNGKISVK